MDSCNGKHSISEETRGLLFKCKLNPTGAPGEINTFCCGMVFLYALNMCCYHIVAAPSCGKKGYNQVGNLRKIQGEKRQSQGYTESHQ